MSDDATAAPDTGAPEMVPEAAAGRAARSDDPADRPFMPVPPAQRARPHWVRWGLFLMLPLVLIAGLFWYVTGGQTASTDDAYVDAAKVGISTDVSGTVAAVNVADNQQVTKGQLLLRLDDLQFRIALARAQANLGMMRDNLNALRASYGDIQTQIKQAQDDIAYYQREFARQQFLSGQHVSSAEALDAARRDFENSQQKLASLRQQLAGTAANLDGDPAGPVERNPRYLEAVAQRDEAQRELDHCTIAAPFDGTVTGVPAVAPGKYLPAATIAFYLVDTNDVWVNADAKETGLTYVHAGQPATVTIDTYPNRQWRGTVDSISPAAAQEFSLLPAENTSGNWVKVVERVPMRVRVDTSDKNLPPLRAGMSAEVAVNTGHARGWPHFISRWFGGNAQARE